MCDTCGCSDSGGVKLTDLQNGEVVHVHEHHEHDADAHHHHHHHDPEHHYHHGSHSDDHHHHEHRHEHGAVRTLEQDILARNDRLAERNRGWLAARRVLALNFVSSPGAGKTSLLERTIRDLGRELPMCVIEGDQETDNDAQRIRQAGCPVVQINTGAGCHLDASMVARALERLKPPPDSLMLIENVGNLVCPALFDLGESGKILVCSVTEGEDKPLKYPHMFRASQLLILNKIDLLPYVPFDVSRFLDYAHQVNPDLEVLQTSVTQAQGLDAWYTWLRKRTAVAPSDQHG